MKTALKKLIKPPPSLDKGELHKLRSHFQSFKGLNQVLLRGIPAFRFADEILYLFSQDTVIPKTKV